MKNQKNRKSGKKQRGKLRKQKKAEASLASRLDEFKKVETSVISFGYNVIFSDRKTRVEHLTKLYLFCKNVHLEKKPAYGAMYNALSVVTFVDKYLSDERLFCPGEATPMDKWKPWKWHALLVDLLGLEHDLSRKDVTASINDPENGEIDEERTNDIIHDNALIALYYQQRIAPFRERLETTGGDCAELRTEYLAMVEEEEEDDDKINLQRLLMDPETSVYHTPDIVRSHLTNADSQLSLVWIRNTLNTNLRTWYKQIFGEHIKPLRAGSPNNHQEQRLVRTSNRPKPVRKEAYIRISCLSMIHGLVRGFANLPTEGSADYEKSMMIWRRMILVVRAKFMYMYSLCRPDIASMIVPFQHDRIARDECEVYRIIHTTLNYLISTENIGFHHNFSQVFRRWEEPAEDKN